MIHHLDRIKDKTHMIISKDAVKAFNKVQHPFIIKKKNNLSTKWALEEQTSNNNDHM